MNKKVNNFNGFPSTSNTVELMKVAAAITTTSLQKRLKARQLLNVEWNNKFLNKPINPKP